MFGLEFFEEPHVRTGVVWLSRPKSQDIPAIPCQQQKHAPYIKFVSGTFQSWDEGYPGFWFPDVSGISCPNTYLYLFIRTENLRKLAKGQNTVSRVLFRKREITEFCGKLGDFCQKLGELALTHQ